MFAKSFVNQVITQFITRLLRNNFCIFNFTNNLLSLHHACDSPPRS
ncbi:hypothetical protein HMPREF1583_00631 [Gardnerella vaginalis JCP8151B]|nr:hypothetical protein HMPREF1586_00417 [Gardnerella vaginalis JCP8522]EPI47104.1 hypothetical protein HMPREF1582_00790 [Gardnerella vaginalis JCP8151A]EPI47118.1 hypothetical protein HMPREF1583_00631 [Gardnerella vaginalis JCP8151B]